MKKALTDALVRSISAPESGRVEVSDLRCPGLALRVTESGAKSWCLRFRDPRTGKTSRATIGGYPDVTLSEARSRAEALRREVAAGVNPVETKRQARAEADSKSFAVLAERYLAEHARRFKRSAANDERNLRLHVLPAWGSRPYEAIARRDVIALVEGIVATGKPVAANRVQALVSSIYSFAVDADLVGANPAARLRKRGVETVRARVLSDGELRLFWQRSLMPPVSRPVGLALRLALLTGLRAGEVAGLARADLEHLDDREHAAITIPAARSKNGRPHFVPLAPLAVETVREALTLARDTAEVFAHRGTGITGHALAVAMRRMADKLPDAPGADTWKADPPTPHDLRRTCATRLAALGVPGEDVSAVLNHTRADVTGRHYDHYARAREKRAALRTWAAALARILEPAPGADVVPIRRRER